MLRMNLEFNNIHTDVDMHSASTFPRFVHSLYPAVVPNSPDESSPEHMNKA